MVAQPSFRFSHLIAAFVALLAMTCLATAAIAQDAIHGAVSMDSSKVVGSEACMKCHGQEVAVWKQTPHHHTFKELHRRPEAKQIAERMGIRSIKRGDLCTKCHYTMQAVDGREKAVAGVSCESCHGAAQDWIAIHNDYGGPTVTKESESAEHAQQRVTKAIRNGMQNPANVYLIARSCYNCHTVPNEQLVNVGGHAAGSAGFELVAWSQGMIRHNFLSADYASNAHSPTGRLRLMYVTGLMTNLEYSLRATANATSAATYGFASAERAFEARKRLAELQAQLNHPILTEALDAAYGVKLKSNNKDALTLAADQVGSAAFSFAQSADCATLGAVDAYLPAASQYKN